MNRRTNPPEDSVSPDLKRLTRRGFSIAGAAALAGFAGWEWLRSRPRDENIPWPLRGGLKLNERFAKLYFGEQRLAREFPREAAGDIRSNGDFGLDDDFDMDKWTLSVEGVTASPVELSLGDIKVLPRIEMTTEFKCIEGWSNVVHWAGARLADFARKYPPADSGVDYVSLETPGGGYYVGLDLPSALHPQTLLAYEMNGADLDDDHGAPLRLVIPVKYGIKNIKRIGKLAFARERPKDYWAERGYDWYAGF